MVYYVYMDMFSALADHTRRDILELLALKGELPASAIYNKFDVSHPAISQHLKVLREAKLVDVEKRAQQRIYHLNSDSMHELESWVQHMTKVWDERFNALDTVLQREKKKLHRKKKLHAQ